MTEQKNRQADAKRLAKPEASQASRVQRHQAEAEQKQENSSADGNRKYQKLLAKYRYERQAAETWYRSMSKDDSLIVVLEGTISRYRRKLEQMKAQAEKRPNRRPR